MVNKGYIQTRLAVSQGAVGVDLSNDSSGGGGGTPSPLPLTHGMLRKCFTSHSFAIEVHITSSCFLGYFCAQHISRYFIACCASAAAHIIYI